MVQSLITRSYLAGFDAAYTAQEPDFSGFDVEWYRQGYRRGRALHVRMYLRCAFKEGRFSWKAATEKKEEAK